MVGGKGGSLGEVDLREIFSGNIVHRVLQGAPPRERQLYFNLQVLQTLYSKRRKHPFLP